MRRLGYKTCSPYGVCHAEARSISNYEAGLGYEHLFAVVSVCAAGKAALASPTTSRLPAKKTLLLNAPNVVGVAISQITSYNTNGDKKNIAEKKRCPETYILGRISAPVKKQNCGWRMIYS